MSRSTNFIGLNKAAQDFVKGFSYCYSGFNLVGISGADEYPLSKFTNTETGEVFLEVQDKEYWQGGPIFLTCLSKEGRTEKLFTWIEDTTDGPEYINNETGIFRQ